MYLYVAIATVSLLVNGVVVEGAMRNKEDSGLETPQLIRKHGYPAETHTVTTEDGYVLTLHRISNTNTTKAPVLLHHTFLCSSACWVIMGAGTALPYLLADEGYDVWLCNARGNKYSSRHKTLKTSMPKFWAFSWHEMGTYDLPATINYVLNVTGQDDLYFVGHSMGSTAHYVLASTRPEFNSKIRLSVSIAPIVFTKHIKHSLFRLAVLAETSELLDTLYNQAFFRNSNIRNAFVRQLCKDGSATQELCSVVLFLYAGFDFEQLNRTMLPVIFSHFPAGTSLKTWIHFGQEMVSGKFRQYDHGVNLNMKLYGAVEPPEYNLTKVTSPVSIHYSSNDLLTPTQDIDMLTKQLPKLVNNILVPRALFNHLDFLWGINVKTTVYDAVLQVIQKY